MVIIKIILFLLQLLLLLQGVTIEATILTEKRLHETNCMGADDIVFHFIRDNLPAMTHYLIIVIDRMVISHRFRNMAS